MLSNDHKTRPSAQQCLKHEYFSKTYQSNVSGLAPADIKNSFPYCSLDFSKGRENSFDYQVIDSPTSLNLENRDVNSQRHFNNNFKMAGRQLHEDYMTTSVNNNDASRLYCYDFPNQEQNQYNYPEME